MKYRYNVYIKNIGAEYSNYDKIYSRVICTPFEVARYIENLNKDLNNIGKTVYYIREEFDNVSKLVKFYK